MAETSRAAAEAPGKRPPEKVKIMNVLNRMEFDWFEVELPSPATGRAGKRNQLEDNGRFDGAKAIRHRALLVGFNPDAEDSISGILSAQGWSVEVARNSSEAVRLSRETSLDLILLDINGVDQFAPALITVLRQEALTGDTAVILAFCDFILLNLKDRLLESGANEILYHPFDSEKLEASLKAS